MPDGRRRIAEGREAEIFEWEDGSVLKLYRGTGYGLELEHAALVALAAAGGPSPRALGRIEVDGRPGLLMTRVDGTDMLAMLERKPWLLVNLARRLAATHAEVHAVAAPAGLPSTKELLASKIENAPLRPELQELGLEHAAALPDGDRLCHGDFHPGNVLVTRDAVSVIDWPLASRGPPAADYARSALLMSIGDPPPVSRLMRMLIIVGRRWFSHAYATAYERLAPADPEVVRHAHIAHVAARVSEGITVEIPTLIGFLERARG
jgi:aminoglycoside phosphotransferase (APT) family kinase protein